MPSVQIRSAESPPAEYGKHITRPRILRHLIVLLALIILPPAARAADTQPPPMTIGYFVAKCQTDIQYCAKAIIEGQDMDLVMSTLGAPRYYCIPPDLTPKDRTAPIMAYVARHADPTEPAYQSLRSAAIALWPCKR